MRSRNIDGGKFRDDNERIQESDIDLPIQVFILIFFFKFENLNSMGHSHSLHSDSHQLASDKRNSRNIDIITVLELLIF